MIIQVIHCIEISRNNIIQLVDNFNYENGDPIVPDDNYDWKDIHGLTHYMEYRNGMPPIFSISDDNIITYYW